jgi:glycosyltransferase involved in cell wall biosynthesis
VAAETTPLFSVVLPTHKRPALLDEAIASVLRQSVDDFECIVVADGDPDVRVPSEPRIRIVVSERREGVASARNEGLRAARGRYVTFLDDDDLFAADRLSVALEGLQRAPVALCWRASVDRSTVPTWSGVLDGDISRRILTGPVPNVGQVALERWSAPLFDARFRASEDVEWWIRAAQVGIAATVPRIGYLLREHPGERQTGRLGDRLESRMLILQTHAGYFASNPVAAAYQWRRVGGIAGALGVRDVQRKAFRESMKLRPGVRGLAHLGGSYLPRPAGR